MKLKVFSDVLDPWSWGLEGTLRAIDFTYKDFSYDYIMVGLVENYENFLPKNFSELNSADLGNKIIFDMYRAASTITKFPHFKEIPKLFTNEIKSSFTLDKYYCAVREIAYEKSNEYMRRLKEYMILKEKNVYEINVQKIILKELEIDFQDFCDELEFISEIFLEDRVKAFDYRIKQPPAFLVEETKKYILGYKNYKDLSAFLDEEMIMEKRNIDDSMIADFIKTYNNVLREDVLILFSRESLEKLLKTGQVVEEKYGNGKILKVVENK